MQYSDDLLQVFTLITDLTRVHRHNSVPFDTHRKENVAEHSYILGSLGCALAQQLNKSLKKPLDLGKVAQFALVHDLTEARMEHGDISVYAQETLKNKKQVEEAAALKIIAAETSSYPWVTDILKEYEAQTHPEARYIYALDKMIVHLYVIAADEHHASPTFTQYIKTEEAAVQKITDSFPQLLPLFWELCNQFRSKPHLFTDK